MWINDQYFSFKQTLSGSIILSATSCDILIVGAGIAGISAAVTSAQKGFHTILLEKNIDFGGVIRSAYLNEMCGLFYADSMQSPIQLNSGLSKIFYNNLANVEKHSLKQNGKVYVLPFQRRNLFTQIDNMLKENSLLEYRNNQEMISLTRSSTMIKNVTVKNNLTSETYTIKPKIVIDCSGAGCVLSAAEQKDQEPICRQLAGVTIVLNCPARCDAVLSLKVPYFLNLAVSEGIFFDCIKYTTISQGENSNELNIKINIDSKNISFSDINEMSIKIHSYLKEKIDRLRSSTIKTFSPEICYREENRLKGKYTITESDILSGRKFIDGCVKAAWPIEYWSPNKGLCCQYLTSGEYYEIPIRSMQAKNITNLLAAGRCISTTPKALASTRVTGTCISLGEQAALSAVEMITKI